MEQKIGMSTFNKTKWNEYFLEIGSVTNFGKKFFQNIFHKPFELKEVLRQSYLIGNKSLMLVSITGFILGLVLTIQIRPTLENFGAESLIPGMVAVSIIREIGPVVTALICAGKIASGIGAELASMKVTEQIDAMEVSGISPFKYLVVTRILSTTLMLPLLVIIADFLAMIGGYVGINISNDISLQYYFNQIFNTLKFEDIFPATIKTVLFGFFIGLIASYKGYNTERGTEGVGIAANSAVVISSLCIFFIDAIAVQITSLIYN